MKNSILTAAIMVLGVFNTGFCSDATLQVKVGDSFTISRPESAGSTGYSWCEKHDNQSVVAFQSKEVSKEAVSRPGALGTARFMFQAMSPGTTTITLELIRPWEVNKAPAKTYTVDVTVSP